MSKRVIILGANGRFGRAAAKAFRNAGWDTTAVTRTRSHWSDVEADHHIVCDVMNQGAVVEACREQDVIVNAVNPPYEKWEGMLPSITQNVIEAAKQTGATVCIPGNVYVYGNPIPSVIEENSPHVGNTKKGKLRVEMEQSYRKAASEGVRTIILRGGDFIEGKDTGNWFETYITNSITKGKITYPGPSDIDHAWAYLPDMARALVELAERRNTFAGFEEFGFEGFNLSGEGIAKIAGKVLDREIRLAKFPWFLVWVLARASRNIREVLEMRYLWEQPHRIDGSKLQTLLPDFQPTPVETATANALPKPEPTRSEHAGTVGRNRSSNAQAQPGPVL